MGCDYTFDEVDAAIKISIHAPHTGCDYGRGPLDAVCWHISIHAPHTGCDALSEVKALLPLQISIHAPHTGCDDPIGGIKSRINHFNPRTPHGVRQ